MLSQIKKSIPIPIKRIPAYIFKSPQRKDGFLKSIWIEIRGLCIWLFHFIFIYNPKKLKPVSICTGIKNRDAQYLDYVLTSVLKMHHPHLIELSVFDCGSDEADALRKKINDQWKGKLVFVSEEHAFTRSYSFNRAIEQSTHNLFFAADADMTLPKDLVTQCNKYVSRRTAWFPVCFSLYENRPAIVAKENGFWRPVGKGMFASTKAAFEKAGKYNARYKTWGWEDIDLWISYFKAGMVPLRTRCKGLIHNWHPSLEIDLDVPEHLKKYRLRS